MTYKINKIEGNVKEGRKTGVMSAKVQSPVNRIEYHVNSVVERLYKF